LDAGFSDVTHAENVRNLSPLDLFAEFYLMKTGEALNDIQIKIIEEIEEDVQKEVWQ
jgi:hypothetical protein